MIFKFERFSEPKIIIMLTIKIKRLRFKAIFFLFLFFQFISSFSFSQSRIIKNIDEIINEEIASHISFDGKKIIYVSYNEGVSKFYEAEIGEVGDFYNIKALEDINNYKSNANINSPVYNYDASRIYFEADYNIDISGVDIFYSDRTNTGWTEPKSLGSPINSTGYDGEPSISPDNKSIYFVRQDEKVNDIGLNCKSIYYSNFEDGIWSEPEILPEPINLNCERTPRILSDNKTLLFSSIRDDSQGGFDLYFAKQLTKNVWMLPISLQAINTEENDLYPSTSFWGDAIIFSISNENKKKLKSNIYMNSLPAEFKPDKNVLVKGKIADLYTNEPIEAAIKILDPNTSVELTSYYSDKYTGEYLFFLPLNKNFLVDFSEFGYSHEFKTIKTIDYTENSVIEENITLYSETHLILNVFDKEIFEPQETTISVKNSETNAIDKSAKVQEIDIGRFDLTLPIGKKYNIEIERIFFETYVLEFDLTGVIQFDEFERDIELLSKKEKIDFLIKDAESQTGISVDIEITNLNTKEKYTFISTTDENGNATVNLRQGDVYEVNINPQGYKFFNTVLNLEDENFDNKIAVELTPLTTETKFELQNITFETNSADLNSSSYDELNRVIELLVVNPKIKIEISAHTDDVGSEEYNQKLSDRRAQSVVNYLIENEIEIQRLIAKGYGESMPIFPNDTDENKAKNRRVELKIVEI